MMNETVSREIDRRRLKQLDRRKFFDKARCFLGFHEWQRIEETTLETEFGRLYVEFDKCMNCWRER